MLFIHDHTFVIKDKKYYTTGSLNQNIMNRYKKWFGNVSVLATYREATDNDNAFICEKNRVENINFNLLKKKNNIFYLLKIRKNIEKEIKKADCIVIRMSIFGAIGAHYAKKHNKPYLIEMVACPWDSLWYHSTKGKILAPFMTIITKKICKNAPFVLYVTNEYLQKKYMSKGKTIGCSDVEIEQVDENILNKRLDKIKNTDIKHLKLCTIANVNVKYKGQELVIKSLKKLKDYGVYCEYYLIGGGNPTRLINISKNIGVSDLVKIVGPKPHEEIFEYLDNMDLYVQPSFQEGLPRAVIEAMSRGCPIIGSNAGGIPELINEKCIFKKGKYKSFEKILRNQKIDDFIINSKLNYNNSKEYEKDKLDKKRENFYLEFLEYAKGENIE